MENVGSDKRLVHLGMGLHSKGQETITFRRENFYKFKSEIDAVRPANNRLIDNEGPKKVRYVHR